MAIHCDACGAEIPPGAATCRQCGFRPVGTGRNTDGDLAAVAREDVAPAGETFAAAVDGDAKQSAKEAETLWSGGYCWRALLPAWLAAVCLSLAVGVVSRFIWGWSSAMFLTLFCAVVLLGGVGLYLAFRRLNLRHRLTADHYERHAGLLHRWMTRIDLMDVDDVAFDQNKLERWLDVGTIKLISGDPGRPDMLLASIAHVRDIAAIFETARRAARKRRGWFIEDDADEDGEEQVDS